MLRRCSAACQQLDGSVPAGLQGMFQLDSTEARFNRLSARLQTAASALHLTQPVLIGAKHLLRRVLDAYSELGNRVSDEVLAAVLYAACCEEDVPARFHQIGETFGVTALQVGRASRCAIAAP